MIQIKKGGRPEEVRMDAEHVLFVEGGEEGVDQVVLRALLLNTPSLRVEVMGRSSSVRSAQQALARHHPRYYFLIDRDHYDDDFVETSWQDFPDPAKGNLLVWRRREIENYFLDPSFLVQSKYCQFSEEKLKTTLEELAKKRVFLDVANFVISSIREDQTSRWTRHFTNPEDFPSKEKAIERVSEKALAEQSGEDLTVMLLRDKITNQFEKRLKSMTGDKENLTYGTGQWVAMIRGKKVLPQLLNSGGFQVTDASGQPLTGKEMQKEIVKDLIKNNVNSLPEDLVKLPKLIQERVEKT